MPIGRRHDGRVPRKNGPGATLTVDRKPVGGLLPQVYRASGGDPRTDSLLVLQWRARRGRHRDA